MKFWIIAHLISLICWFAGLFYLPRLFVYHAMATDPAVKATLLLMEKKLYGTVMRLAMILTLMTGARLFCFYLPWSQIPIWLWFKLFCVVLLLGFHHGCGFYIHQFEHERHIRSHRFFRWWNEIPTLFLVLIISLVILKPHIGSI